MSKHVTGTSPTGLTHGLYQFFGIWLAYCGVETDKLECPEDGNKSDLNPFITKPVTCGRCKRTQQYSRIEHWGVDLLDDV